jgi:hypothetical protein
MNILNKRLLICASSVIFIFLVFIIYLSKFNFELSALVAAPRHVTKCGIEDFKYIKVFSEGGSDGVYNYLASKDPLFINQNLHSECIERSLDYTRIRFLYHFSSWIFSLGNQKFTHLGLLFSNIFYLLGSMILIYKISSLHQFSKFSLFALAIHPGVWLPIRFSTVDLSWHFTFLLIYYFWTTKKNLFWIFFSTLLSLLSREISIGFIAVFIISDALSKQTRIRIPAYILAILIYYLAFKSWINTKIPTQNLIPFQKDARPSIALFEQMNLFLSNNLYQQIIMALLGVLTLLAIIVLSIGITKNSFLKFKHFEEKIISIGYSAPLFILPSAAWGSAIFQFPRLLFPCFLSIFILSKSWPKKLTDYFSIGIIIYSLTCAIQILASKNIMLLNIHSLVAD